MCPLGRRRSRPTEASAAGGGSGGAELFWKPAAGKKKMGGSQDVTGCYRMTVVVGPTAHAYT